MAKQKKVLSYKESEKLVGKVKWFSPLQRYGFIQPVDGSADVFVHSTAVKAAGLNTLLEDCEVLYELVHQRDGRPQASNLQVQAEPAAARLTVVPTPPTRKGVLVWFSGDKGYGFIQQNGVAKDVFLHINHIEKSGLDPVLFSEAKSGRMMLSFDVEKKSDGNRLQAVNIRID